MTCLNNLDTRHTDPTAAPPCSETSPTTQQSSSSTSPPTQTNGEPQPNPAPDTSSPPQIRYGPKDRRQPHTPRNIRPSPDAQYSPAVDKFSVDAISRSRGQRCQYQPGFLRFWSVSVGVREPASSLGPSPLKTTQCSVMWMRRTNRTHTNSNGRVFSGNHAKPFHGQRSYPRELWLCSTRTSCRFSVSVSCPSRRTGSHAPRCDGDPTDATTGVSTSPIDRICGPGSGSRSIGEGGAS